MSLAQLLNSFRGKPTESMSAWQHSQSAIGLVAIVEVQANRQHQFEEFDGRLNMGHSLFDAPWAETGNMNLGVARQRQVLMPRHQPIGIRGLVKINGSDWAWLKWQLRTNNAKESRGGTPLRDDSNAEPH